VSVINTGTDSVIDTINVGQAVGIAISPDGSHLYVSHYGSSSTVSVIDTTTDTVVDTIRVGNVPEYLAIGGPTPTTFTDNFSPPSTQWSNSIGNWTAVAGEYFAQAPSNGPLIYSGLPYVFTNSNLSLTVTINGLRDEGIWLDTHGTYKNGILLVLGGNAQQGNWAYWHIATNGALSAPLDVNTNAFTPDLTYTVTVLITGNTYRAYLDPDGHYDNNSVLLTTLVDSTYSSGHVGLYGFYSGSSFSNFSVSGFIAPGSLPPVTEALKNDTGSSPTDNITKDATLTGSGDANAIVSFTVDGKQIATTVTADTNGNWVFAPTGLGEGQHTVIASEGRDTSRNHRNGGWQRQLDVCAHRSRRW
jgi:YVTN family beta-propeller protein